jgi:alpha-glucoside transport system substrate-binding protein
MQPPRRLATAILAATLVAGLATAGCAAGPPATPPAPAATPPSSAAPDPACAAFQRYGDLTGTTVSILETDVDGDRRIGGYRAFAACTGTRIEHRSTSSIIERLRAGDRPDLGYLPEAGSLGELVRLTGAVSPAPPLVAANVAEFYPETYRAAGSVDGTLYAAPLDATVKSLVWYSPRVFAERGYPVPATRDELLALARRMAADGSVPWCAAAEVPLVDQLEGAVLGSAGPEIFDAWVDHAIPTDAPQVATALDAIGEIVRDPTLVDGGDPASIASSPAASGQCLLHQQSDRYATAWPDGTDVSENGAVFAFRVPVWNPDIGPTALVGGGFVAAFNDRREVQALQAFLSTPDWANAMSGERRDWVSPSSGLDPATVDGIVARLALGVLQDPRVTLRYDGSDRMPAAVGSAALPQAITSWIGGTSTADALATAETAWPRQ